MRIHLLHWLQFAPHESKGDQIATVAAASSQYRGRKNCVNLKTGILDTNYIVPRKNIDGHCQCQSSPPPLLTLF